MRNTITISIPKALRRQIDRVARAEGVSKSALVRASLRDYLFLRQFRGMRKAMLAEAARRGVHTDQDVFDRVS